jgi:hypothetical protein
MDQGGCRLGLELVGNGTGKCTSGMGKFSSVDRMHLKLAGNFFQFLEN